MKFCENRPKQGINFDKINWLTLLFQSCAHFFGGGRGRGQ